MKSRDKQKKSNGATRPIRTERDYMGAATVVKKIGAKTDIEPAEEQRLRTLIQEMERFDGQDDDSPDDPYGEDYTGARRRWSDGSADPD